MDLLEKKKQDNAGEITAVILGSWQLFNKNLEQREGRANDRVRKMGSCYAFLEGASNSPSLQEPAL